MKLDIRTDKELHIYGVENGEQVCKLHNFIGLRQHVLECNINFVDSPTDISYSIEYANGMIILLYLGTKVAAYSTVTNKFVYEDFKSAEQKEKARIAVAVIKKYLSVIDYAQYNQIQHMLKVAQNKWYYMIIGMYIDSAVYSLQSGLHITLFTKRPESIEYKVGMHENVIEFIEHREVAVRPGRLYIKASDYRPISSYEIVVSHSNRLITTYKYYQRYLAQEALKKGN